MRLIDADKLITEYDKIHIGEPGRARKLIEEQPTVDAVEVVRCKDCIFWEQDVIFEDGWCRGKHQGNPNWFCADGERKDGCGE